MIKFILSLLSLYLYIFFLKVILILHLMHVYFDRSILLFIHVRAGNHHHHHFFCCFLSRFIPRGLPSSRVKFLCQRSMEANNRGHAIIIGAGVAGVCTAYQLALRGSLSQSWMPPQIQPCQCSHAAAGGMQRMNPMFDRNSWFSTMKSLVSFQSKSHFYVRFSALFDPHLIRWGISFTNACWGSPALIQHRAAQMLKFTNWSIDRMQEVIKRHSIDCDFSSSGALKLHFSEEALEIARKVIPRWKQALRMARITILLNREQTLEFKPFVGQAKGKLLVLSFKLMPERANLRQFTQGLHRVCEDMGVNFVV